MLTDGERNAIAGNTITKTALTGLLLRSVKSASSLLSSEHSSIEGLHPQQKLAALGLEYELLLSIYITIYYICENGLYCDTEFRSTTNTTDYSLPVKATTTPHIRCSANGIVHVLI